VRVIAVRWDRSEDAEVNMNKRGAVNAGELVGVVIAIAVAIIMLSAMFTPALDTFYGQDTADWGFGTYNETSETWESGGADTKSTTMWYMLPMMAVVCALMLLVGIVVKMLR